VSIIALISFSCLADSKVVVNVTLSPAGSFQAESKKLKGQLTKKDEVFTTQELSVRVTSFKTGIDLRDEHFSKHLDPSKSFPNIILTNLIKKEDKTYVGNLEVNGQKKSIQITIQEEDNKVIAKFKTKPSLFGLAKAEYLGVGVVDEVLVEVVVPFKKL